MANEYKGKLPEDVSGESLEHESRKFELLYAPGTFADMYFRSDPHVIDCLLGMMLESLEPR